MFSCESDEIMNGEKIRDFRSNHGLLKDVKQYWPEGTAEIYLYLMALNITVYAFIQSQTSHYIVWIFVTYKCLSGSWVHGQVSKCKPSKYKSKV